MTSMVAKVDDLGTPLWIAMLVLAFVVFWPVGLALLAFLLMSGRLGSHYSSRHWCSRAVRRADRWAGPRYPRWPSGNTAFDEYREQTLERLEGEQREFRDFLRQLRRAKDRTEFDQFIESRREPKAEDVNDADGGEQSPEHDASKSAD